MMTDPDRGTDRAGRRAKRFLTPLQKYEIFLQLVRQEVTLAEAADTWKVDRSTFMRIRTVAKEGALEALAHSRPGVKTTERDWELEVARADAVRLAEALKEMAVKLMLIEGNSAGAEWPRPKPRRRGHQIGPVGSGSARRPTPGGVSAGRAITWSSARSASIGGWNVARRASSPTAPRAADRDRWRTMHRLSPRRYLPYGDVPGRRSRDCLAFHPGTAPRKTRTGRPGVCRPSRTGDGAGPTPRSPTLPRSPRGLTSRFSVRRLSQRLSREIEFVGCCGTLIAERREPENGFLMPWRCRLLWPSVCFRQSSVLGCWCCFGVRLSGGSWPRIGVR